MRYACLLLTTFLLLNILPAFGQRKAKVDTVAAFQAFNEGARLEKAAKYDSAIANYHLASEGYKAYALSLPEKQKYAGLKKRTWEQYFMAKSGIGWSLKNKGQNDSALKLLLESRTACRQELGHSNAALAKIANIIGVLYADLSQFNKALEFHHQGIIISKQVYGEQHPSLASSYNNIGLVYRTQRQFVLALEYFNQAIAVLKKAFGDQHPNLANIYISVGLVYKDKGNYTQALKHYQLALALWKQTFGGEHPYIALCYNNIGNAYFELGQNVQAMEYYQQVLAIRKKTLGKQHSLVGQIYNQIGNVYMNQRQYALAQEYYLQAIAIQKKALGEQHRDLAVSYSNIGTLYSNLGKITQALDYFQQALAIWKQALGEQSSEVAKCYPNIGFVYVDIHQYTEALKYFELALAIEKQALGEQHPDVASNYSNIGLVYFKQGQYQSAIQQFQQSLNSYLPNYKTVGYQSLLSNSQSVLYRTLTYLSQALYLNNASGDDTFALATVRFADRYIDSLRRNYTYENDKLALGKLANELYQVAIDIARWNKLDEEAFYYSEKNKAAILAQSLNEATALKLGGIPDSLLEKDKEMRSIVAVYTKAVIEEELKCPKCDSTKLTNLKDGLFKYQQQHTALKSSLEAEFPQYFALKYLDTKISVKEIQKGFLSENPNSAILEYMLGDTVLYSFCITKDQYSFHRQKLDSTRFKKTNALQLEVKKLARALGDPKLQLDPTTAVSQPASALYDYLIKPFEQLIKGKDLVIIPDAELNKIPFEMLMKPNQNLKNIPKWQELPYLIKQHNIGYHYSARLLLDDWQKGKTQPVKSSGLVAFAPVFNDSATGQIVSNESSIEQPYLAYASRGDTITRAFMNDGRLITPLPGTEREVKAIYELFNQKNLLAKYYLNDQANEATVQSLNLKPYKYLHFATHGLTDEDHPTQSCLILAQNQNPLPSPSGEQNPTPNSDNLLTSSEMYGLELDAELVVLSACQTGKGTLKAGEGIIGLTRGLLYAGARNLLVSQWNVNDASTAELMTKFYAKILAGHSNRQALREAKLELLNSKFACPHYWSAFVLVGR
jgi:CHAT domain-containing protein/Tfp pilus assembly protein PilF